MKSRRLRFFCLIISYAIFIFALSACDNDKEENISISPENYGNLLNVMNIPNQSVDWDSFCFSDLGAWYGFALPDTNVPSSLGSFSGPFLMTHGEWLSKGLSKVKLYDATNKKYIALEKADKISLNYYPGRLNQNYQFGDLSLSLNLIFISKYSSMISLDIINQSTQIIDLKIEWVGDVFNLPATLLKENDNIIIDLKKDDMKYIVNFSNGESEIINDSIYKNSANKISVEAGGNYNNTVVYSMDYGDQQFGQEIELIQTAFKNSKKLLVSNRDRWNSYLTNGLMTNSIWSKNDEYTQIAVKCISTLTNNWRTGIGALENDGIIPSYAVWYFNGFWAWDSWKHAVGVAHFNPELAKNQIRVMFARQDKYGMIPDVIYADSTEDNWRDTKPPLAAWAVWRIFEETNDKDFLNEMYSKLIKYHEWWYLNRDHDQNGLCEYGGTDKELVSAMWESGMDDAVRFDNAVMLKNNDRAWSINQESVDLNSYLYAEKGYLAKIAKVLLKKEDENNFLSEAERLKFLINQKMYDEKNGFYYDINVTDKSFIKTQGPEGWIPLWAGVAEPSHALRVKEIILDTSKFATFIPFPTVSADDEKYMSGYWRGPVWLDQAYFAIKGLKNYGYNEIADNFTEQLFDKLEGLKNSNLPIRENYDPRNGNGLKVNHFSWSAAHLLLLYLEK
jgi:glucosidase